MPRKARPNEIAKREARLRSKSTGRGTVGSGIPDTRGGKVVRWVEKYCRVPEGKDVGKPLVLRSWQRDVIYKIYDNEHGTRAAIISWGRKNAKTTLSACLLLVHLCGPEMKYNSQLYSTAQSREQAAVLFALAAKIVRLSPVLSKAVVVRDTAKQLFCQGGGTLYRALSAEVSTAYGLSPAFVVHDELGQVKGPKSELYDAIETATGAQSDPLSIIISTQAPTEADLLSVLIDDARAGHDPRTILVVCEAPRDADPFTIETIRLANPAVGDFLSEKEVLSMAEAARRMPSREPEFRNLILNQRVEASSPFISRSAWTACGGAPKSLEGARVFGGLDLSTTQDLSALVLVGQVGGLWNVHPTFWLPGESLAEKSKADRVPYDVWARQGFIVSANGKVVDYEMVAMHLQEVIHNYDVVKIGFDRWNFKNLVKWLQRVGVDDETIADKFVEFGQGFQSMSPALRALEESLLQEKLRHGNHPVLTMCAANAVVQADPAGNRKLAKNKSAGRIDGMVALAIAIGTAALAGEESSEPQLLFV